MKIFYYFIITMDKQYLIEGIEKMSEGNKDIYIQLLKILVLE
jgi:hypothetical protein